MIVATLHVGDWRWSVPAAVILAITLFVLWWAYRRVRIDGRVGVACVALKAGGIALLAISLVEPLWSGTRARPGANLFVLLADNSQSLTVRDAQRAEGRGEELKRLLTDGKSSWQVRLGQDFDVRRYLVDSQLRNVADFGRLSFDGDATALRTALVQLGERLQGRPLAGVLLFTDGNATDLDDQSLSDLSGLPPIYPVVIADETGVKDIALEQVAVTQTAFEDAPVSLRADVAVRGYGDREIVAQLLDEAGGLVEEVSSRTIDSRRISDRKIDDGKIGAGSSRSDAENEVQALTFQFQLRPTQAGLSFYRVRVAAKDEGALFDDPAGSSEATLANNSRWVAVDRGEGPFRALYVSGRPNWEFKFLRRAMEEDEQIELVGLVRIAKREPKFDWRGRAGESSNPLFRGFKADSDESTERYDEPVLIRLNAKDADELRSGFPATEDELYRYHAVIIDDLEADFFTREKLALLKRFVSERGGGLLMLGGQESFHQGGYGRTPVGELLPIYLDRSTASPPKSRYRLSLTRDGWLQPWVRLRRKEEDERQRLDAMPAFHTLNRAGSIKPGAHVLALAVDEAGEQHPALVVQRYGLGRSAALAIGDLWRWQLNRPSGSETPSPRGEGWGPSPLPLSQGERGSEIESRDRGSSDDLGKAWRQTLRWLVADVPERIDVQIEPHPQLGSSAVSLQARVRGGDYQPLENASVQIAIQPPGDVPLTLAAEPSLKESGLYETVYVPRKPGVYRAEVNVVDLDGHDAGTAKSGWVNGPAQVEFSAIVPNRVLMEQLARQTGGELVAADELEQFVNRLAYERAPITEQWTYPLWHQSWVFLLAVCCLVGEWGLRRWRGLP